MKYSNVTVDGITILKMLADGVTDVDEIMRAAIDEASFHRRMSKWARRAGISAAAMSSYYRKPEYSMTMFNIENLLEAAGLRLTIEVNE